jgi:hypothetical protein
MLKAKLLLATALATPGGLAKEPPSPPERALLKLLEVRTLYIEPLRGEGAGPLRDMLISSLQKTGLFALTENADAADAFLRGSGEDLIYQEMERRRAGVQARGAAASSRRESGESTFSSGSFGVGDTEDTSIRERRHEALAAVRIVLPGGEIIWSTTQESNGAKYRGSAHDVAEKVSGDLLRAYRKAQKLASPSPNP